MSPSSLIQDGFSLFVSKTRLFLQTTIEPLDGRDEVASPTISFNQ